MSRARSAVVGALVIAALAWLAQPAGAVSGGTVATGQPVYNLPAPDPLSPRIFPPASQTVPPPSFAISARQAVAVGERTKQVRDARKTHPDLIGLAYISPLALAQGSFYHWDVFWTSHGKRLVEVEMGRTGKIFEVQTAPDVGFTLVRGYPGVLGGKLNAPYIWLPLCLLFIVPFFDPRRPFRLLHLDLLMLLAFGISHFFFAAGRPNLSVPLVYPFLAYVTVRMAFAAFRPIRRRGALMPQVTTRFLVIGVIALLALRIGYGMTSSGDLDITTAGVIGADRIEHGLDLYVFNDSYGDTYGPVNYLMYIPSELAFPFTYAKPDVLSAARPATLTFDLLTVLGLFLLGRSLRPGRDGTRMGAALAYAWTAYPYTSLVIASNTNDTLVPLFVIYALLLLRSPPARGALGAIAALTKFAPLLVAPVLAVGRGPFRLRTALVSTGVYVAVLAVIVWLFLPDGGFTEFWKTTLGFQLGRSSPLGIWTRDPGLSWLHPIVQTLAIVLALVAAFVPRRRTTGQVAALCAAIFAAAQIPANYWIYFYTVWFAPFMFISLFEEYRELGPLQASVTRSFWKPVRISQPESVTATRSSILTPSKPGT